MAATCLTCFPKIIIAYFAKFIVSNPFGIPLHLHQYIFDFSHVYIVSLLISLSRGNLDGKKNDAELLFQALAERHERKSVIITTNLGLGDWTQIFGDPTLTAAPLDRITHKARVINCCWDSYRLKDTLKKK